MPLRHFLIVFDIDRERLISREEYIDADEATEAYALAEQVHRDERNLEIVLIGADSLDTVRRSHSNYFSSVADSPYLATA